MADDKHPFINALLDGMTNGVEQSAGTLLAQLKSQQSDDLARAKAGEDVQKAVEKRAAQIAELEKLLGSIQADREKRTAQAEAADNAAAQASDTAPELKPWWKDVLNKDQQ